MVKGIAPCTWGQGESGGTLSLFFVPVQSGRCDRMDGTREDPLLFSGFSLGTVSLAHRAKVSRFLASICSRP